MKIKRRPLIFTNVIKKEIEGTAQEYMEELQKLRRKIIKADLYTTAPIIYQELGSGDGKIHMRMFIALNQPIDDIELDEIILDELSFEDGISIRYAHADEDIREYYGMLEAACKDHNLEMADDFYHIKSEALGEPIIDIYLPVRSME